jgi:CheY-like chemotaxis protein
VSLSSKSKEKCSCHKLLIVDDDQMNLYILKNYIVSLNIPADFASNGQEAVEYILARAQLPCCHRYTLVFMDINMPVMSGPEAASKILQHITEGVVPPTPIIALSAHSFTEAEQTSLLQQGFTSVLEKPISKQTFAAAVQDYLH